MALLYKSDPARGTVWARLFAEKAPDIQFRSWPDVGDPADIRYLATWQLPDDLARTFPNLEVLFSVSAGVDQLDLQAVPAGLPVVRMVESGIIRGMVEYVTMSVLCLHRNLFDYLGQQRAGDWSKIRVLPATRIRVGVLGLGVLGTTVCETLSGFGYDVAGWSRSRHDIPGVQCFSGEDGMDAMLGRSDILVCLVPLTAATRGFLDATLLAKLPRGARLVNVGRGGHLDHMALVKALDGGQLSFAMLDVTDPEPLPPDHPLWRHPKVSITPHIASMTQPETAVEAVLDNIRRHRAGEPMEGLVDRSRGY